MLKRILLGLAAMVVVLVLVIAVQPGDFRIARSATIAAPPAAVFAQVNDFHNWETWSPWAKTDPAMRQTYEGAPAGAGAVYTWAGNAQVGEGRMTVTESRPHELIRIDLAFLKPLPARNTAEFTFVPEGDQTRVTWSMTGRNNFAGKAVALLMNMDRVIGEQFEAGLASIKSKVEGARPR